MPIDFKNPDEIGLGKDLKVGDCVRSRHWSETKDGNDMGIIVATTFHDDPTSLTPIYTASMALGVEVYTIS